MFDDFFGKRSLWTFAWRVQDGPFQRSLYMELPSKKKRWSVIICLWFFMGTIAQHCPDWDDFLSLSPNIVTFLLSHWKFSAQLHSIYRAWTILVSTFFVARVLEGWLAEIVVYVFGVMFALQMYQCQSRNLFISLVWGLFDLPFPQMASF